MQKTEEFYVRVSELPVYALFSFSPKGELLQLGEYDVDLDRYQFKVYDNPSRMGYVILDTHVYYRG